MDVLDLVRSAFALGFVIALIYALSFAAQRFKFLQTGLPGQTATSRLTVMETKTLDPRRKLILIRCDGQEHLILLGLDGETVLQSADDGAARPDALAANISEQTTSDEPQKPLPIFSASKYLSRSLKVA